MREVRLNLQHVIEGPRPHRVVMAHLRLTTVALTLLLLAALVASPGTEPASAKEGGITGITLGCICHSVAAADDVQVHIEGLPDKFRADSTHELTVRIEGGPEVTENSSNQGGFNLRADAGFLANEVGDDTVRIEEGEATHTDVGNNQREWTVLWTAPSTEHIRVTFTLFANSVDGDGIQDPEDHWNTTTATADGLNYIDIGAAMEVGNIGPGAGIVLAIILLLYTYIDKKESNDEEE